MHVNRPSLLLALFVPVFVTVTTGAQSGAPTTALTNVTVTVGKIADLVLVDADPLASVANCEKQTGTMLRGRWYPRAELLARVRTMDTKDAKDAKDAKN